MTTLPTVGRIMHYYTQYPDLEGNPSYGGPRAVIVSGVQNGGESISGCVFTSDGMPMSIEKIPVVQPEDLPEVLAANTVKHFVTWMPYQVATHAKAAAEAEIKTAAGN